MANIDDEKFVNDRELELYIGGKFQEIVRELKDRLPGTDYVTCSYLNEDGEPYIRIYAEGGEYKFRYASFEDKE